MTKFTGFSRVKRVAVVAVSAASLAGMGAGVADAAVPQGAKWSAPAVSQTVKSVNVAAPQGAKWRTVAAASRRKCYKRVIHRHGVVEMRRVKCPKAAASKATWGRVGASVTALMPYRH